MKVVSEDYPLVLVLLPPAAELNFGEGSGDAGRPIRQGLCFSCCVESRSSVPRIFSFLLKTEEEDCADHIWADLNANGELCWIFGSCRFVSEGGGMSFTLRELTRGANLGLSIRAPRVF